MSFYVQYPVAISSSNAVISLNSLTGALTLVGGTGISISSVGTTITINNTAADTPVTIGAPANGLSINGSQVLSLGLSSTSTIGALSDTDWNTFNSKQAAGSYIKADGTVSMTGDFNVGAQNIVNSATIATNGVKVGVGATPATKIPFFNGAYITMLGVRPVMNLQTSGTLSTLAFTGPTALSGVHINFDDSDGSLTFATGEGASGMPPFKLLGNNESTFSGTFSSGVPTPVNNDHIANKAYVDTAVGGNIPLTQKGAANGVATLDSGGKVPVAQLPNSVMEYKGTYDASTNTPTLVNGTGNVGDTYRVNVAGAGVNSLNFVVGDYVIYDGAVWQKAHSGADAVNSVNGFAGIVVLSTTNIGEGTNLYFTDTRARTAAVQDTIVDGVINIAPSQNAVFDALALKVNTTDVIPINRGGTGQITQQAAINALSLPGAIGTVLRSNGTNAIFSAIQASDIPTLNQNTTGTASNITASSNSTLTTLSVLSLPGSQVTGNIAGNAANITATSNATLTTLSVLSLPGAQVTGNISGNAANVTGIVAIANGGTGQTTQQTAINALSLPGLAGTVLRSNGTNAVFSAIQASDVPTLNQNTTGTASNITATSNSTLTTLSALSLPGSQVTGNIAGNAANITATSNSTLTTLSALSLPATQITGILPLANGGTNKNMTAINGGIVWTDVDSMEVTAAGTSGQVLKSNGASAPSWSNTGPLALTILTATSAQKTPTATGNWSQMTSNSVTLTAGTWELFGSALYTNSGSPGYTSKSVGIYGANGADNTATPTLLSATSNLTVNSVYAADAGLQMEVNDVSTAGVLNPAGIIVTVTTSVVVYCVPYASMTVPANARINTYLTARQLY